jgi:hypothetical protein
VKLSAVLSLASSLIGLLRDFLSWRKSADDRRAGRDAARAEAVEAEKHDLDASQAAVNEADARHGGDPTDNAFTPKYMRDD